MSKLIRRLFRRIGEPDPSDYEINGPFPFHEGWLPFWRGEHRH